MNQIDLKAASRCDYWRRPRHGFRLRAAFHRQRCPRRAMGPRWGCDHRPPLPACAAAASGFVVDVASEGAINAARQSTLEAFGQIDIVVNNAGITGPNVKTWNIRRPISAASSRLIWWPYLVSRALVPQMIERGYGRIVNIASVAGRRQPTRRPQCRQGGLIGLTKSLGKELATSGVLCNCVTPAAAETDIFADDRSAHRVHEIKDPDEPFCAGGEIAAMVAWLASEDCSFTTGGVF